MNEVFASGRIIDLILGLVACEWIALAAYRLTRRGVAPRDFSVNLVSGVFLMLAVRQALTAAAWGWVAACLLGALTAHVIDLAMRWRR